MKKQSLSSPPNWGLMATVRERKSQKPLLSPALSFYWGENRHSEQLCDLSKSTELLNGRFDPGPSSPDSRPDIFFLIHAESIWHLCSYHSRTVSYHHYLLEIPQVKGRVPSKAATSDASCKFWVSPGHLHLWSADYKFRGSYNPFRFDDSLEWPTELRKALLFIVTVVL